MSVSPTPISDEHCRAVLLDREMYDAYERAKSTIARGIPVGMGRRRHRHCGRRIRAQPLADRANPAVVEALVRCTTSLTSSP